MKMMLQGMISLLTGSLIQISVQAEPSLATGFLKQEMYLNISGSTIEDLTGSQKFLEANPDTVNWLGSFESAANAADNYGQRLSGFLVPPLSGTYVFFIASDDYSELWLSTDAKPENKQLIASVFGYTGSREWNKYPDTQNNAASPIRLQAGQPYYIEALMKEGGGGDNLAVGWTLPNQYVDPGNPPDGLTNITVISSQYLGGYVEITNSKLTIITQPTNLTSFTGQRAVFSVTAQGTSDLGSLILYQWKRDGTELQGATYAFYTTPELTLADNGARFSCVVSVPGVSVTSQEAILTVLDALAPQLHIASAAPQKTNVVVWWETPDPGFYLQGAPHLLPVSWQTAPESVTYQNTRAQVTAPVVGNRFFRLSHTNVLYESLWADSVTPASVASAPSATELGTVFSTTAPGLVRAIRFYIMPGESGIHLARVWRNRDNQLVGGP